MFERCAVISLMVAPLYLLNWASAENGELGAGIDFWWSAGLVIAGLRVPIPAGSAREFSSPELMAVSCKRPRSFCQKCRWRVILKHAYTLDPTMSEWADYAVQA